MKKHFLKAVLPVLAGVALLFSACGPEDEPYVYEGQNEKKNAIIVGNCDNTTNLNLGLNSAAQFGAATEIPKEDLAEAGGAIRALRIELRKGATNCEAFIATELGSPVVTKTFDASDEGWVYIPLDTPYVFMNEEIETFYIGYTCDLNGTDMSICFQQMNREFTTEHVFMDGKWMTCKDAGLPGRFSIQAIVDGGNYDNIKDECDLAIQASLPQFAKSGNTINIEAYVANVGKRALKDPVITYTIGGQSATYTMSGELLVGMTAKAVFSATAPTVSGYKAVDNITLVVDPATEGSNASSDNEITSILNVYSAEGEPRNAIVIEQFTSQQCGNCPAGATALQNAIDAMTDPSKVIWIAHHAGFSNDNYTVAASDTLAQWLGVYQYGNPAMDLNRAYTNYGFIYHPLNTTTEMLNDMLSAPTQATINLETAYSETADSLSVKVTGKSTYDGALKINVLVLQDGMSGAQSGATGMYTHNHAPRIFMTPAHGEALTVGENGNYTWEGSVIIPESVGSVATVPDDMYVVAFIAMDGSDVETVDILNGAKASLIDGTEVENPETLVSEARIIAPFNVCVAE